MIPHLHLLLLEQGLREHLETVADWERLFAGQKRQIATLKEAECLIQRGDKLVVNLVRCRREWRYFGLSALPDWDRFLDWLCDGGLHASREVERLYPFGRGKLAHALWLGAAVVAAETTAGRIFRRGKVARHDAA